MIIEIYGPGCLRCHAIRDNVGEALQRLGLKDSDQRVTINQIKDLKLIAAKGIILPPAIVIDGVKLAENKVPDVEQIKKWIEEGLSKR